MGRVDNDEPGFQFKVVFPDRELINPFVLEIPFVNDELRVVYPGDFRDQPFVFIEEFYRVAVHADIIGQEHIYVPRECVWKYILRPDEDRGIVCFFLERQPDLRALGLRFIGGRRSIGKRQVDTHLGADIPASILCFF